MEPFPAAVAATNDRQRQVISVLGDAVAVSDGPDRSKCVCGAAVLEGGGRGDSDTTRHDRDAQSYLVSRWRGVGGGGLDSRYGRGREGGGGPRWFILWSGCRQPEKAALATGEDQDGEMWT